MKSTPPQILSGGALAIALATAVTAGAALATNDTTETDWRLGGTG